MRRENYSAFYHIALVTDLEKPMISDKLKNILYDYLDIKGKSLNCEIRRIGGTDNHVHLAICIPPSVPVCEVIENLKSSSANYIKKNVSASDLRWKEGFYLSTISPGDLERIEAHIDSQVIYHLEKNIQDELTSFYCL